MAIKGLQQDNISLSSGIHRTPSIGDAGELSECVNLIPKAGELVTIPQPSSLGIHLDNDETLLHLHETSNCKNFITYTIGRDLLEPHYAPVVGKDRKIEIHNGSVSDTTKLVVYVTYKYSTRWLLPEDDNPEFALTLKLQDGASVTLHLGEDYSERSIYHTFNYRRTYLFTAEDVTGWDFMSNPVVSASVTPTIYVNDRCSVSVHSLSDGDEHTQEEAQYKEPDTSLYLYYRTEEDEATLQPVGNIAYVDNDERGVQCVSLGNILIVRTPDGGLNYFYWKDGEYKTLPPLQTPDIRPYLETRLMGLPSLLATFGEDFVADLNTNLIGASLITTTDLEKLYQGSVRYLNLNSESKENLYTKIFSITNQVTYSLSRKGLFYAPFFVRFALRMFDGTHVLHTSPILLTPTSLAKPFFGIYSSATDKALFDPIFSASELRAIIKLNNPAWKDLLTHLDVYVSPPLVDYTANSDTIKGVMKYDAATKPEDIEAIVDITEAERALYEIEPWYQKERDKVSHILTDYAENDESYFAINSNKWVGKKTNTTYSRRYRICYVLIKTSDLENTTTISTLSGTDIKGEFKEINPSQVIFTKKTGGDVTWADTGVTDVANYSYLLTASVSGGKQSVRYGMLIPSNDIDVTYVFFKGEEEGSNKPNFVFDISSSAGANIQDKVQDNSSFFLVKSIPIDEIVEESEYSIDINEFVLNTLESRETLSDLGQMRNYGSLFDYITSYNNRFHAVVSTKSLPMSDSLSLSSPAARIVEDGSELIPIIKAYAEVQTNGQTAYKTIPITSRLSLFWATTNGLIYVSYPNRNTTRIVIATGSLQIMEVPLRAHPTLNLALSFNLWKPLETKILGTYESEDALFSSPEWTKYLEGSDKIKYGNRLAVTGEGNPFRFDETLGVSLQSEIMAMAAPTKALSQGQFGQFPLYAFCQDGIWALEVSSEGTYSAKQPVSRDIMTKSSSLCQIDNAVIYVTKQGLKIISGSDVQNISTKIAGLNISEEFFVNAVETFYQSMDENPLIVPDTAQFVQQIQDAKIVYDYANNLLHVFPKSLLYGINEKHYVYSFMTGEWSTQVLNQHLITSVPVYPLSILQMQKIGLLTDDDSNSDEGSTELVNGLYSYTNEVTDDMQIGYALTRSNPLGDPLSRKMLADLRLIGQKTQDQTLRRTAVYVSNDNRHWQRLTSLKKMSAKYYRFLVMGYMHALDTLSGISIQYQERYTNKLR